VTGDVERPFQGVVAETVAGAAIGFVFGGPAGAAAGGLVPLGERLVRLSQTELFSREARAEAMWVIASHEAGTSREAMLDAAERDADRLHMGYSAGQAAATSRYPARVVALGRALAHGIPSDDAAELDHWQLMIDAIAEVERPHLVLLSKFANIEGSVAAPVFVRRTLDWDQLNKLASKYGQSLHALLAALERLGLINRESVAVLASDDGRPSDEVLRGAFWRLTDFGYAILDELWRAGGSETVSSVPQPSGNSSP